MPIRHLFASQADAGAPFASIGGEPRDLGLLHRYQRFTLYGGAVLLSALLILIAAVVTALVPRSALAPEAELA